ncbi:putative ABC-type transport system involved in lysophospholipase L1 biosynthesis, permease component [Hoeflea phototrophica DFL-43]|uniref:Putative ABC-type transport system involved in lysophospholipase L1 biosynthesis, permease component n=1 Tax=Hoeflea phototrophica (strain DSM 17068 / NCIMB 14078 / DFL-43) TaxID=411684 RepID=A9CU58_HOEPD|nr:ABC transporter permease [Hoeflea phototrophica]EDQ35152.1 putative ABC-type transport system involved in lysophospholipase L1 biosynthesis, permease component [Hoeflea phototrophica DFL-43]
MAAPNQFRLGLAVRLALRELRGGLSGFYIFLACVALGTAAIAGVNSVSQMMTGSIASEGRTILGGDIRFESENQPFSEAESSFIEDLGDVSTGANLRTMARTQDGSDQSLVELRAVDGAYPLYGSFQASPDMPLETIFEERDGVFGAATAQILLDRLGLSLGDEVLVGQARFELRAIIVTEPDSLSEGFGFAPRFLISRSSLDAAGLIRPGSLIEYSYRVRVDGGASAGQLANIRADLREQFPETGLEVRTSRNAAPALTRNIERFSQFLTLVGLTALIVGGVGIANSVRAWLDGKRGVIATLKCVGAPSRLVVAIYLIQVMLIAGFGVFLGLLLGLATPFFAAGALSGVIPVAVQASVYPASLIIAAGFGLMTAFAFAVLPLGRAGEVPATALFRQQSFEGGGLPRWPYLLAAGVTLVALCAAAIWFADDRGIASVFVAAVVVAFGVLRLVGFAVQAIARKVPAVRSTPLRLAIGNIHRPGALTPSVVLSLGLGLALLVTLALIDTNLRRELSGNLPDRAPNFFFVDIQSSEIDGFENILSEVAPEGKVIKVPMLRGRILELKGEPVNEDNVPAEARWVLRGDRGVTYTKNLPENSRLSAGEWWAPDHQGEPLVSFSSEEAGELGLSVGDTITVSVLGRSIVARIANLRDVEWESLSINFVMVFSPNTFAGAPHSWMATLQDPDATAAEEGEVLRAVTQAYPTITSVRVKDALELANRVVGQIGIAIRAAALVALIASVLVLAGALAAGNRSRIHDAVVLKTLGATRVTLIRAYVYEYGLLGLATAVFALAFGAVASWFVVSRIMTLPSSFMPDIAAATLVGALVVTVGIGLLGTWRVLGQKAAPVLREL